VQPAALYTCPLQYEDSISCTLYRFLLHLRRRFDFAPFSVVGTKKFRPQQKSSSSAFSLSIFHPSIHPSSLCSVLFIEQTLFHKNPPSLSSFWSRPRRILRFSRSPFNPFSSSSFYQSASFALWVSMFRDLCSVRIYFPSSISSMPCQSLSNLRFIHRSRNQLFPQSYDSCLRLLPLFFSVVFALYSSRYPPKCLLYNIVNTL
jgi:hypothetical protein